VIVASRLLEPATADVAGDFVADVAALFDAATRSRAVDAPAIELPVSGASAAAARQFVDDALRARRRPDLAGVATLLVSEIVTNAVVHARSTSRLSVVEAGAGFRVQVTDWGDGAVELRDVSGEAIGGRGLHIVDAAADRWGTVSTPQWKTVFFEVGGGRAAAGGAHRTGAGRAD
jgi:anti-sigma regulatory factor (Ser/Thr protein kinase)